MKRLKFILILPIILLTSNYNSFSKVYFETEKKVGPLTYDLQSKNFIENTCGESKLFEGTDFPVLDICIFLSKFYKSGNKWKSTYFENKFDDYTAPQLCSAIIEEEAIIASSNLIRDFLDKSENQSENKKINNDLIQIQQLLLNDLNNTKKWLKLITKDQEFVVLIPKKKYPKIKDITDIKKINEIGLNSEILSILEKIDANFENTSFEAQKKRLIQLNNYQGLIAQETLSKIFLKTQNISKRIYLSGHGAPQKEINSKEQFVEIKRPTESGAEIAQLSAKQYQNFIDKLQGTSCSILIIASCDIGGWNATSLQNFDFYTFKNTSKKFNTINQDIFFITVSGSTSDTAIKINPMNHFAINIFISKFFTELNSFFEKQRKILIEYLETQKDPKTQKIYNHNTASKINNNTPEDELLSGSILNKPDGLLKIPALIERQPSAIDEIGLILKNIIPKSNTFSVRFPGHPFFTIPSSILEKAIKIDSKYISEKIKNKTPIEFNYDYAYIYPSVVDLKIKINNSNLKIISMIPGRAQHYIEKIIISENTQPKDKSINIENFYEIFKTDQKSTKLYFIKELNLEKENLLIRNLTIKRTKYIFLDVLKNKYFIKSGKKNKKELTLLQAKNKIKKWINETTPSPEAIYEASYGTEDTSNFQSKINTIFENMFNTEDISNKKNDSFLIEIEKLKAQKKDLINKLQEDSELLENAKILTKKGIQNNQKKLETSVKEFKNKIEDLNNKIKELENKNKI